MQQVLLRIPVLGIPIFGFGAMLCLAFLVCTWLAGRRARREGIPPEYIQDLAVWLLLGGVIGARALFLADSKPSLNFVDFLWQMPRIWDGGIILYGAVAGGFVGYALFYVLYFRKHGILTAQLADIIAPAIALGVGLGRVGCFLNGCCYGQVACAACAVVAVHFPLSAPPRYSLVGSGYQTAAGFTYADSQAGDGVRVGRVEPGSPAEQSGLKAGDLIVEADGQSLVSAIETPTEALNRHLGVDWERGRNTLTLTVQANSDAAAEQHSFVPRSLGLHPTQIYETISMVLLVLFLQSLYAVRTRFGIVMAALMMAYGVHRALNELLRNDPRPEGLERYSSYLLSGAGLLLALYLWRFGRRVVPGTEAALAAPPAPK